MDVHDHVIFVVGTDDPDADPEDRGGMVMKIIDAIARMILILMIGIIIGATWVIHELTPQIDKLTQEVLSQDNQIRLLKAKAEMHRVKERRRP